MGLQESKIIVHDFKESAARDELRSGTSLLDGTYTIEDYLGADGFGITYTATDDTGTCVVIKECFPAAFCCRRDLTVEPRSTGHREEMASVVSIFVTEARRLSRLNHPNIVTVHNVFEENGTAYMVMDLVEGRDLLDVAPGGGDTLSSELIQSCLEKLLDGLSAVHRAGILHRDISPGNIIVSASGEPVLIDFATARGQATKASRILSVLRSVNDGYSPQEAYISGGEETPSCDLYSLGASFYHLITGELPAGSQSRVAAKASGQPDPYIPLGQRTDKFEALFCDAIDKAMSIVPRARFDFASAWLDALKPEIDFDDEDDFDDKDDFEDQVEIAATDVVEVITPRRPVPALQELASPEEPDDGALSKFLTRFRRDKSDAVTHLEPVQPESLEEIEVERTAGGRLRSIVLALTLCLLVATAFYLSQNSNNNPTPFDIQMQQQGLDVATNTATDGVPIFTSFEPDQRFDLPAQPFAAGPHEAALNADGITTPPEAASPAPFVASSEGKTLDEITWQVAASRPVINNSSRSIAAPVPIAPSGTASLVKPTIGITAEPTLAETLVVSVAPVIATSVVVPLPFTQSDTDPLAIASVEPGAPAWMSPGLRIVSLNDTPISSISEISFILAGSAAADSPIVSATLGIEGRLSDEPMMREHAFSVAHDTTIVGGLILRSSLESGVWRTVVTSEGIGSTLSAGDRIIGIVEGSLRVEGPLGLATALLTRHENGEPAMAVAVERDGKLWVEVLALPTT